MVGIANGRIEVGQHLLMLADGLRVQRHPAPQGFPGELDLKHRAHAPGDLVDLVHKKNLGSMSYLRFPVRPHPDKSNEFTEKACNNISRG
jgi:hypothetical protein